MHWYTGFHISHSVILTVMTVWQESESQEVESIVHQRWKGFPPQNKVLSRIPTHNSLVRLVWLNLLAVSRYRNIYKTGGRLPSLKLQWMGGQWFLVSDCLRAFNISCLSVVMKMWSSFIYSFVHSFIKNSNNPLLVLQPLDIECVIKHTIPIKVHRNCHSHGLTIQQNITKDNN